MKKSVVWTAVAFWLAFCLSPQSALAEFEPSYSVATQDIPAGAVISKQNIREIIAPYPHPRGSISGYSIMFGSRTVAAIKKGDPITTAALCINPGRMNWDKILPTDDPWKKFAKLAAQAQQNNDYEGAIENTESMLQELKKLADAGIKFTDYCEMCYLSVPLLSYEANLDLLYRKKERQLESPSSSNLAEVQDRFKKRLQSEQSRYNAELQWHQRALPVLSQLMTPDNDNVKREQDQIEQIKKRSNDVTKQIADQDKQIAQTKESLTKISSLNAMQESGNKLKSAAEQGDFDKADSTAIEAMQLVAKNPEGYDKGLFSLFVLMPVKDLISSYRKNEKFERADKMTKELYEFDRQIYGANSIELMSPLIEFAETLEAQNKTSEAEARYKEALGIADRAPFITSTDNFSVMAACMSYARLLKAAGRKEDAVNLINTYNKKYGWNLAIE